ncbi:MAG TPA: GGDEF domain-containing protein [Nitrospirae bacterium]|nr:response regulator PleD [bacterium BMS3Abin10]GBE37960.1 response regulator PleD [bacterium BMS3Bbin08]HDH50289.1 GGDEF domain-containing protein [Nitrospirota bacterium]HDK81291.1 GGDEF domain-containing protein [Nitrospirota bacterium]
MKKNISLIKRILIHSSIGCLAGFLFLHPISVFISDIVEYNVVHFVTFQQIFAPKHLLMAGYFAILGLVSGIVNAFYIHKRAGLYKEIELLSITDELTSLYNRRYFINQLSKEIERARRYSHYLSLLIIDLNNFKQVNDTHGHQQGDKLLKEFAVLLKKTVRKPDFVARYGGDEFVIVMPEADNDKALKLLERLHKEVESHSFTNNSVSTGIKLTASIGTATFPSEAQDLDELITKADSILYAAKKGIQLLRVVK